jgi:outer membrane immunogenic protein
MGSMKKLAGIAAGTTALVAAFTSVSWADGMPAARRVAAAPAPVVVEDRCGYGRWTGFYAGGNIGFSRQFTEFRDRDGLFDTPEWAVKYKGMLQNSFRHVDDEDTSFTAGGQVGYNFQCKNIVFGFETDINWLDHGNNDNNFINGPHYISGLGYTVGAQQFRHDNDNNYVGTIRGRIGWTDDRILVYATGGAAYGNPSHSFRGTDFWGFNHSFDDDVKWGWTAGGGVEFLAWSNWTFKIEALWIGWEDGNTNEMRPRFCTYCYSDYPKWHDAKNFRFDMNDDEYIVRVGVNYLFNRTPPPVEPLK